MKKSNESQDEKTSCYISQDEKTSRNESKDEKWLCH